MSVDERDYYLNFGTWIEPFGFLLFISIVLCCEFFCAHGLRIDELCFFEQPRIAKRNMIKW